MTNSNNNAVQVTVESLNQSLTNGHTLINESLCLNISGFALIIRSNTSALIDYCRYYFSSVVASGECPLNTEIHLIESDPPQLDIDFKPWKRESANKKGKDAYFDFPSGRIIKKVRTGMIFLQSQTKLIAAGRCFDNKNQIVNYINSQYMNWLQQQGAIICHAAGLVYQHKALGLAGFSGGGKSTLMLHMLEKSDSRFLSNDRLFIKVKESGTQALGIPKLPRINPGTALHNPRLKHLIDEHRQKELLALPNEVLWELEEKHDVIIEECYGQNKILYQAPIKYFLVLNWSRESSAPVQIQPVDLTQRQDLLAAIMKRPGPFYQYKNGDMYQNQTPFNKQAYLDAFSSISVYEAMGGIDFDALSKLCYEQFWS